MSPRVVAFVHAKGSSERVPGKNLRVLGDRPLFCHAIAIARAASLVDEVVIDSDHDGILSLGEAHGATALRRPARLASNSTTGDELAHWQACARPGAEIVLQVIPTAPFLAPASVDRAIAMLDADRILPAPEPLAAHQFTATTLMSVASLSSTPQLTIGGLRPRPRKLKAVSPRIMLGMDMVAEAIRCDMNPGTRCRPMMRLPLAPISCAART